MAKKFIAIIICLSIFTSAIPQLAFGLTFPDDAGTGTNTGSSLSCTGIWTKLICVIKKITDIMKTIDRITKVLDYAPHQFPFGGPILSSEPACRFKFNSYTRIINPLCFFGACIPPTIAFGPIPITRTLGGRAIEVGPPVPSNGKVIAFPWISKIYQQHTEKRAGPWALGLGFSPFPLKDINDALGSIHIWIPPQLIDPPCSTIYARLFLPLPPFGFEECVDNFRFECEASGEKDLSGNDIYKVIRLLGTSKEDVSAEALQNLKTNFSSFPWF